MVRKTRELYFVRYTYEGVSFNHPVYAKNKTEAKARAKRKLPKGATIKTASLFR